jgi:hypothetical protein
MAQGRTFDQGVRARVLYDEGHGCNSIAKALGVSPSTISGWAKSEGLDFDRKRTSLAVRAHVIDAAESRMLLVKKMLAVAHESLDRLDEPYTVYAFGGQFNDFESAELDEPPMEVVQKAQSIAKEAFLAATKAIEQTPEGLKGAESLLDRIEAGLSKLDDDTDDDDVPD